MTDLDNKIGAPRFRDAPNLDAARGRATARSCRAANQATGLTPVAGMPVAVAPVALDPDATATGRITPVAADPDPTVAAPLVVAANPDRTWTGTTPALLMIPNGGSRRTRANDDCLGRSLARTNERHHEGDQRQREDGKTSYFHHDLD